MSSIRKAVSRRTVLARAAERLDDPTLSGRTRVLRIIYYTTLAASCLLTGLLLTSFAGGNAYVGNRIATALVVVTYIVLIGRFIAADRIKAASWMTILLYLAIATATFATWGINVPAGILTMGFVIVLTGRLLGARYVYRITLIIIGILIVLEQADQYGLIRPDYSSLAIAPVLGDAVGYAVVFAILAVITWVSNRALENTMAALEEEKQLLSIRLDERTRSLRESQLEEMRQLYRFAELGQLSTLVLHDLANNLTTLTLDIDDLETQTKRSSALDRAKETIGYLDAMIAGARRQLRETDHPVEFDVAATIRETVEALSFKAARHHVRILPELAAALPALTGDPLRFAQIITILTNNAIEAYANSTATTRDVVIKATCHEGELRLGVSDTGEGIAAGDRDKIFEPFHTTKPYGMGIGLFIAHEIVRKQFDGSITLAKTGRGTRFIITIPTIKSTDEHG